MSSAASLESPALSIRAAGSGAAEREGQGGAHRSGLRRRNQLAGPACPDLPVDARRPSPSDGPAVEKASRRWPIPLPLRPGAARPRRCPQKCAALRARVEWLLPAPSPAGSCGIGTRSTAQAGPLGQSRWRRSGSSTRCSRCSSSSLARFAVHAGRAWGVPACLVLALAPAVRQLRSDAQVLVVPAFFTAFRVPAVAAARAGCFRARGSTIVRAASRALAWPRLPGGRSSGDAFLAARASGEVRWQLFAHHRLFEALLYLPLDARPLLAEREALLGTHAPWPAGRVRRRSSTDRGAPRQAPPHVVFLMLDSCAPTRSSGLGGPPDAMPAMNRLVEQSVPSPTCTPTPAGRRLAAPRSSPGSCRRSTARRASTSASRRSWQTLPEAAAGGLPDRGLRRQLGPGGAGDRLRQGFAPGDFTS